MQDGSIELDRDDAPDSPHPPNRRFIPNQLIHLEDDPVPPSDHFEVDYINGHREKGGTMQFKVHWRGYDDSEETWEPIANFPDRSLLTSYADTCSARDKTKITKALDKFYSAKAEARIRTRTRNKRG
ncbi:hypothetical protein GQ54DRAFT_259004 [Martensiomyces pterosporus]|nr:hypothetical protein GQ54DRAFT_259004 [Martensiomyces pterosporus]